MKNRYLPEVDNQVLNFNKPIGWTSFDVVKKVRSLTGIKKVGHAGSLDPFASGVLLITTGTATKKMNELLKFPKTYQGVIRLGLETDTLDPTGKIIKETPVPDVTEGDIREILKSFEGEIEQDIPAYSATKHKGQRLYKLARKGQEIPRLTKKIIIYEINLLTFAEDKIRFEVKCGSGTYIRTLARDIAKKMGTVGYLTELTRTEIGPYKIEEAWSIKDFEAHILSLREKIREQHEDLP